MYQNVQIEVIQMAAWRKPDETMGMAISIMEPKRLGTVGFSWFNGSPGVKEDNGSHFIQN